MRKLNGRSLRARALAAKDAANSELQWIADNAQTIADEVNAELDDAIRARRYDGDGRGGARLTGPEAAADARMLKNPDGTIQRDGNGRPITPPRDPILEQVSRLLGTIDLVGDTAVGARTEAGKLITSHDLADRQQQHHAAVASGGRGRCENCDRWCEGTRNDRLITPSTSDTNRQGAIAQCPPCLIYWKRNGELRPPKLWDAAEFTGEQVNTAVATDTR